jgi:ABC-type oligopeptide transport system ATPase subunit
MSNINSIHDHLERIGMIGSPSTTTELTLDILQSAVNKKLIGELATFKFMQDGKDHYAIGQITEVELRNVWLEGASLRSIARQKGTVNPVSEQQDTHIGQMTVSAVFSQESEGFEQSMLGTVPATGTYIKIASDELLQKLLEKQQRQLFYLGNVYGSTPLLPMTFRHFGRGENGAGEAYHIGVFGKTGSGKSTLTKMVLSAYMRFPELGILILDPQGEFSKDFNSNTSEDFKVPLKEIAQNNNKKTVVISVRNFVLDRWELFEQILGESSFFERLSIPKKGENRDLACRLLIEHLKHRRNITLNNLHTREAFNAAWQILQDPNIQTIFYRTKDSRDRFNTTIQNADAENFYTEYWLPVANLFSEQRQGARKVEDALKWLINPNPENGVRPILVIDLSKEKAEGMYWNERIQALVIKRLLQGLNSSAEYHYKSNQNLNTMVVIDEAHRLAPKDNPEDYVLKSVKSIFIDSILTTRKYGLGWFFISQTLSSIDKTIVNQLRISFFGFGLSMGMEFQSLKELAGGDANALKLYQSFRDPHSTLNPKNKQYSFMTIGPVSPLSFAGTPLFFTAFNDIKTFLERNGLQKQ